MIFIMILCIKYGVNILLGVKTECKYAVLPVFYMSLFFLC